MLYERWNDELVAAWTSTNHTEEIEAETRAIRFAKERITLCRRDIAKMIATGIEEGVPTQRAGRRGRSQTLNRP